MSVCDPIWQVMLHSCVIILCLLLCVGVESLVMGRLHRDLATFITQCCADEQKSNRQCVEVPSLFQIFCCFYHTGSIGSKRISVCLAL